MKSNSYKNFTKSLNISKRLIVVALIVSVLHIACSNAALLMLQDIVNSAVADVSIPFDFNVLGTIILIFLYVLFGAFADFLFNLLSFSGSRNARQGLYIKILKSPMLTKRYPSGDLLGRAFDDAATIGANVSGRKIHCLTSALEICVILAILYYFSWLIGILTTVLYPFFFFINIKISSELAYHNKKVLTFSGNARQTFLQGLKGIFVLRHIKKENYYHGKFKRSLKYIAKTRQKAALFSAANLATQVLVSVSLPALMVIVSLFFVNKGHAQAGTVLLIYALVTRLLTPANSLNSLIGGFIEDKKAYERVKPIFEYSEPSDGEHEITRIDTIDMDIKGFSYAKEQKILEDFNLSFCHGDRIGILGGSGEGKSTILKLLMRQEELKEGQGSIRINDVLLKDINSLSLYNKMLLSSQNNFLFEGTLAENICMGTRFCDEEIDEVIKACCLDKFIETYGFDRVIKEDCANISGGQVQRICLARILIRKPEVLLLDEPTAALDNETSESLAKNLKEYLDKYDMSMIVVTHKENILQIVNKTVNLV